MSDRAGQARALTIFTPIQPGAEPALRDYLRDMPRGASSPLARSSRTHVGRWHIIDRLPPYEVPRQDELRRAHLLFSVSVDGDERSYLEQLTRMLAAEIPELWGRCEGYPGLASSSAFVRWLLEHRVRTSFFFAAYSNATVNDVREALATRRQALAFALRAQEMDPADRLAAFREEFP